MIFQLLKSILVLAGTITGVAIGYSIVNNYPDVVKEAIDMENPHFVLASLLGFIGYLLCSMIGRELNSWLEKRIEETNIYDLAWGSAGFAAGVVVANLLIIPFYIIMFKDIGTLTANDRYVGSLIPLFYLTVPVLFNLLFAYLGVKITLRYKKYQSDSKKEEIGASPKLIDTKSIIDGRFADLFKLGFIDGRILIPNFIVNELLFLVNSDDITQRNKGQKGLELVENLKKSFPDRVVVVNNDFGDIPDVDGKLIKLAAALKASIITQDYTKMKVAELENIKVLNLNDLTNALKPIFVSGENLDIEIVKKGKEPHQGVGFLSDGTMVVVEDGGNNVGERVKAKVNNILQTGNGRIVFCRIGDNA